MGCAWPLWPRPPIAERARDPLANGCGRRRRLAFTGRQAEQLWSPRLDCLADTALAVELELVRSGRLAATVLWTPYAGLSDLLQDIARRDLAASVLHTVLGELPDGVGEDHADRLELLTYGLLIARAEQLDEARDRLASPDREKVARWLGYPPCCARAWAGRLDQGISDPIAALLCDEREATKAASAHAWLASLGVGPVRHAPCSDTCQATAEAARAFIEVARALGHSEEASWLEAMSDWSVDVSIASGVAELKTGLFRYTWPSDDLGAGVRRRRAGSTLPEGTPSGLSQIFASPAPIKARRSKDPALVDIRPVLGFRAAGFASAAAMRSRLSTVLWEQSALLRRSFGSAIHFGCGDGLLLELLAHWRPTLRLLGVETDSQLADAARRRSALADASILVEPWSDAAEHLAATAEADPIVFLDPERLEEQPIACRTAILERLKGDLGATIVLMMNDRGLEKFGGLEPCAAALGLGTEQGRAKRVSAIVQR
jgi:hypothetical protein